MDYQRKYLKYKAKYLELKAKIEGGLITEAVRPTIIRETDKEEFRNKYFNKPNYYIAYKVDNTHIPDHNFENAPKYRIENINIIFNVRVCEEECASFDKGKYALKSIEAKNIISCDPDYVIIESDEWAELKEPVKPKFLIQYIPNGFYARLKGIVSPELLDEIKSYVNDDYNDTTGPIGFGGRSSYYLHTKYAYHQDSGLFKDLEIKEEKAIWLKCNFPQNWGVTITSTKTYANPISAITDANVNNSFTFTYIKDDTPIFNVNCHKSKAYGYEYVNFTFSKP